MPGHIRTDRATTHAPFVTNALTQIENGRDNLGKLIGTLQLMLTGALDQEASFSEIKERLGTVSNLKAKEAYEELVSLDFSLDSIEAALSQAFNKFR